MIRSESAQVTPEICELITNIDEVEGACRALGTLAPERLSELRRIATIESIGSSTRLEGSRLSDREIERLLSNLQTGNAHVPDSLRALAEQVRRLDRKIEREKLVLPALSLRIVELIREHGRITIGDAVRWTGGNRNTLKLHFRSLVEQGLLEQYGSGRGAWYQLR